MATTLLIPQDGGQAEKGGIVNDFMYGSNVAASHIYIRMGELMGGKQAQPLSSLRESVSFIFITGKK